MKTGLLLVQWALLAVQVGSLLVLIRRRRRAERLADAGLYSESLKVLRETRPYSALSIWLALPVFGLMILILAL